MKRLIFFTCLLATPAFAQQQQPSPPETALQINGVIGQWAQLLVQQAKLIEQLQAELAQAKQPKLDKPADKEK